MIGSHAPGKSKPSYSVYVMGKGKTGRLGVGDFKKRKAPFCIPSLKAKDITNFSFSISHAGAVIGSTGEVWMWGDGEHGALGRGNISKQSLPMRIVWQKQVTMIACGDNHTLAIANPNAEVFAWGRNDAGQLGSGNTSNGSPVPILVEILCDIRISSVAAGENISAAISEEGDLYTWGAGQLGTGMRGNPSPTAVHMSGFPEERWVAVAFGNQHAVGLSRSGLVFTWGNNSLGQLGLPHAIPRVIEKLTPVLAPVAPVGVRLLDIAAGGFHSAAIGNDGRVYAWGANSEGQIGNGECDAEQSPTAVAGLLGERCAIRVACGAAHTIVLTAEGEVYSFGNGEAYQLGLGDKKSRLLPEQVILPAVAVMLYASGDASAVVLYESNSKRAGRTLSQSAEKPARTKPVNTLATGGLSSKLSTSVDGMPYGSPSSKSFLDSSDTKRIMRTMPTSPRLGEVTLKKFSVVVTSWNCNARRREAGLSDWLLEAAGIGPGAVEAAVNFPDIIAVGVQEMVKMRTDSVMMATASQMGKSPHITDAGLHLPWQQDIDRVLIPKGYERIGSKVMVGIYLAIYIKADLVQHTSNLQAVVAPCGVMGKIGNKGAVAIRFNLYATGFCFVCSHLAAGSSHEAVERRNQDWKTIASKIHFSQGLTIFDHENLFWFGDLNYRLDMSRSLVIQLIESKSWPVLQRSDQLCLERLGGRAFLGFKEPPLNFEPTYKYDPGTNTHDTSEKNRTPAWCDRILYRGESIENVLYRRHDILDSDHRPISGAYLLVVETPTPLTQRAPISALSKHRPPSSPPSTSPFSASPRQSSPPSPASSISPLPFPFPFVSPFPSPLPSPSPSPPPFLVGTTPVRPMPLHPTDSVASRNFTVATPPKNRTQAVQRQQVLKPRQPNHSHAFVPIAASAPRNINAINQRTGAPLSESVPSLHVCSLFDPSPESDSRGQLSTTLSPPKLRRQRSVYVHEPPDLSAYEFLTSEELSLLDSEMPDALLAPVGNTDHSPNGYDSSRSSPSNTTSSTSDPTSDPLTCYSPCSPDNMMPLDQFQGSTSHAHPQEPEYSHSPSISPMQERNHTTVENFAHILSCDPANDFDTHLLISSNTLTPSPNSEIPNDATEQVGGDTIQTTTSNPINVHESDTAQDSSTVQDGCTTNNTNNDSIDSNDHKHGYTDNLDNISIEYPYSNDNNPPTFKLSNKRLSTSIRGIQIGSSKSNQQRPDINITTNQNNGIGLHHEQSSESSDTTEATKRPDNFFSASAVRGTRTTERAMPGLGQHRQPDPS